VFWHVSPEASLTQLDFNSLGLSQALAIATQRFLSPTRVQASVIPLILRGGDVQCFAATGEGKTAAFVLPLLSLLIENPSSKSPRPIRVLVLVPTRELATQIAAEFKSFASFAPKPIKIHAVFGGAALNPQMMALRGGADVLVATPGRLLDLTANNAVKLNDVCTLVLDEADKLAGGAFSEELNAILTQLPNDRQTLWFSATKAENDISSTALLTKPDVVNTTESSEHGSELSNELKKTSPLITQRAIAVDAKARTQLLRHLINQNSWKQVLVFVASKHGADILTAKLNKNYPSAPSIVAQVFHANLTQTQRSNVLDDFKNGLIQIVVATDVAARGLHIDALPVVINYDLPRSPHDYTHRIGRTGRAGNVGLAVSLISVATLSHFALIQKHQGHIIELEVVTGFEPLETTSPATLPVRDTTGGIKGKRPSKKDKLRAEKTLLGAI
jgi:ATP-dependent RNA helicase RhlE